MSPTPSELHQSFYKRHVLQNLRQRFFLGNVIYVRTLRRRLLLENVTYVRTARRRCLFQNVLYVRVSSRRLLFENVRITPSCVGVPFLKTSLASEYHIGAPFRKAFVSSEPIVDRQIAISKLDVKTERNVCS